MSHFEFSETAKLDDESIRSEFPDEELFERVHDYPYNSFSLSFRFKVHGPLNLLSQFCRRLERMNVFRNNE